MEGEQAKVYDEKEVTARKRHKCCECDGWIEPGEKYLSCHGLWEGMWQNFKVCKDCDELRDKLKGSEWDEIAPFECLYEWVGNWQDYHDDEINIWLWFWEICIRRGSFSYFWIGEKLALEAI